MLDSGSFLGRSILTSKPTSKLTARRTGTWQPPRREDGPEHKRSDSALSPSEAQRDNIRVPPSGVQARTMPNPNTTTQFQPSGKSKAPPPNRQTRASFPDRSLSSSTSQRAEQSRPRSRTSDVDSAPKPARSTAGRYQAEVDQIEKERDADDLSFVDSPSQSSTEGSSVVDSLSQLGISQELSQDTLRINRQHAKSPSNPSRTLPVQSERRLAGSLFMTPQPAQPTQQKRTTNQATAGAQSTQQKRAAHQVAVEAPVQPVQQRRPAHHAAAEAQPAQPKQSAHQDTTTVQPTQQSRIAHQVAAEAPAQPTQQKHPARRDTTTAQPTQQQKRPASQTTASEETPSIKRRRFENYRRRNKRYENPKPASQAQRKHAVGTLKSGAEDIEYLEAKVRLQNIKSDLAREELEFFKLEHKMRQRDLERLRRHGGSVEDALCV